MSAVFISQIVQDPVLWLVVSNSILQVSHQKVFELRAVLASLRQESIPIPSWDVGWSLGHCSCYMYHCHSKVHPT